MNQQQIIKGFSLIEVLASILVLAGLISIVVQLSYGNTRRMKKARQLDKIAGLLELKMRELEEEFKGEKIVQLPDQDEGDFESEKNYSWSYKTQPLTLPHPEILLSLIQIPENEFNTKMAQALTDILSENVVELKLTVYYNGKKGGILSYSLVSYFINYEDAPGFIFNHISEILPKNTTI